MPPSDEAIEELRSSLKATRRRLEDNTEALQASAKELKRFNENIEDALEALNGMMPVLEGAAAGSDAIKMGVEMFKGLWAVRQARRGN